MILVVTNIVNEIKAEPGDENTTGRLDVQVDHVYHWISITRLVRMNRKYYLLGIVRMYLCKIGSNCLIRSTSIVPQIPHSLTHAATTTSMYSLT